MSGLTNDKRAALVAALRFDAGRADDPDPRGPQLDARHQFAEPLWLGDPARCTAFSEPSVIDELKIESADGGRFAIHFCLKLTRLVPGRLPAHGRVERKDEPPARAGWRRFWCALQIVQKRIDLGGGLRRFAARRQLLVVAAHAGLSHIAVS